MVDPVVTLDGVCRRVGAFQLGPVSLEIEPGYMVAVVGPNGSGKTTLFRLLMNLLHAQEGEIRLFGQPPGDDVALKQRIGYVPERSVGHDQMSADDLGAFYAQWYPRFDTTSYGAAVDGMDVEPGKAFGTLSKGVQRRVAFALAMATNPDLLLCDELTDGVDPFARRAMLADIARFMERGDRTVVFATHNMDEVRRLADYVAFLVNGVFHGLYEKDALLDDWRRLWVEGAPDLSTRGVVKIIQGQPAEVISSSWRETREELERQRLSVVRTSALDLTEILGYLMQGAAPAPAGEERPLVASGG